MSIYTRPGAALLLIASALLLSSSAPHFVGELFVNGLNQPRGLVFDDAGNLFVAEAGALDAHAAGDASMHTNHSGRVVRIAPNRQVSTVVVGLPFTHYASSGTAVGATDVAVLAGNLYVLTGEGYDDHLSRAVLRAAPGRSTQPVASILNFMMSMAPMDSSYGAGSLAANPYAMVVAADGTALYVSDGASGYVLRVSLDGTIRVFAALPDLPVTGLAFGADNRLYVAAFSRLPHLPGSGAIWVADPSGGLTIAAEGLTMPIDVGFDAAGTMYVLEFSGGGQSDHPYAAGAGRLLRIERDGTQRVMLRQLNYPTAMAFSRSGDLYIAVGGAFTPSGQGAILKIPCLALDAPEACLRQ
jgi:DNA-binding beta-propeller fold protein YncE